MVTLCLFIWLIPAVIIFYFVWEYKLGNKTAEALLTNGLGFFCISLLMPIINILVLYNIIKDNYNN